MTLPVGEFNRCDHHTYTAHDHPGQQVYAAPLALSLLHLRCTAAWYI